MSKQKHDIGRQKRDRQYEEPPSSYSKYDLDRMARQLVKRGLASPVIVRA